MGFMRLSTSNVHLLDKFIFLDSGRQVTDVQAKTKLFVLRALYLEKLPVTSFDLARIICKVV